MIAAVGIQILSNKVKWNEHKKHLLLQQEDKNK